MIQTARVRQTLSGRLREETRDLVELLENLPFTRAARAQSLPLDGYIGHLALLAAARAPIEAMADTPDPAVRAVWREDLRWLPWLEQDLAYLRPLVPRLAESTALASSAGVRALEEGLRAESIAFLGHLYAFERCCLDAAALDACAAGAYGLVASGRAFWMRQVEGARDRWIGLSGRLDLLSPTAPAADRVVVAARNGFATLIGLLRTLQSGVSLPALPSSPGRLDGGHLTPSPTPAGPGPAALPEDRRAGFGVVQRRRRPFGRGVAGR